MDHCEALTEHLTWWGLQRFATDRAYYQWQRQRIKSSDLQELNRLVEARRQPDAANKDEAFYDLAARADLAEVLYSQRYDYYLAIGPLIAERVGDAQSILDFGCGIGVLTTFYARCFPDRSFVGIDRSVASVEIARARADALGLKNIRFERLEAGTTSMGPIIGPSFDVIISTHSLLQTERDLGIPSVSWREFRRGSDIRDQHEFEQRTGLGRRLDALCDVLKPAGSLLLFEKTRPLARRIPFQRALAARGFRLIQDPIAVRYTLIEELADDGPLYMVRLTAPGDDARGPDWDESPESSMADALARYRGDPAQSLYRRIPRRQQHRVAQVADPEIGMLAIELGSSEGLVYLFIEGSSGFSGLLLGPAQLSSSISLEVEQLIREHTETGRVGHCLDRDWPASSQGNDHDVAQLPLYENHTVLAQTIWEGLPGRQARKTETFSESDGRQMHIELGETGSYIYLYWANTFDQRQLVMVEQQRADLLEDYYAELLVGGRATARKPKT
jgi:SAM-dependent methyltransferase